jgi:peptide chain release factor 1
VRERRCRRRIRQVVGRNVNGLERRDRAGLRRRDALLQHAHLLGERRLIAYGRRHAAEQRRDFRPGERVAVDVVDEHQHVFAFVAEVLGHRETRQRDAQAIAGGLVHLAEHERDFLEHARVFHLVIEVVALASALADAREHGVAAVLFGDVVDELEQRDGLAYAGAAEQSDLAAFRDRHDEVDDLDAGLEQLDRARLLLVGRRLAVNRPSLLGPNGARVVDRVAENVHDAAEHLRADGHGDRLAGVPNRETAAQAFRRAHRDRAHDTVAELLLHLERQVAVLQLQRVIDFRDRVARKLDVDDGANDLNNRAGAHESLPSR